MAVNKGGIRYRFGQIMMLLQRKLLLPLNKKRILVH